MTTVNSMVPLWQRPRGEVTDEEYEKFYQSIAHAFDKPQRVITASVEGAVTYKALLFIPSPSITPPSVWVAVESPSLGIYSVSEDMIYEKTQYCIVVGGSADLIRMWKN